MKWKLLNKQEIKDKDQLLKILLNNRGLKTKKEIDDFLDPKKIKDLTHKDLGLSSSEIKKAISRIKKAIKNKERIIVYGDYDADGICGVAVLWEALFKLKADVLPFIPSRDEGYGLKSKKVKEFAKDGVKLIITVDNGIVAGKAISEAKELGVDVIVCDHHVIDKRRYPKQAKAIVHSTLIVGATTAWYLANKLLDSKNNNFGLDLVAIASITDMIPLVGVNRSLVKYGIEVLRETKRLGLLSLFDFASLNRATIGVYEIGFVIGPRLNASGRVEDPMESLRLLCTLDENRAISLAQRIDQKNKERRSLTTKTVLHAKDIWLAEKKKGNLIFIVHESYHEGIIGLVAGKLTEEFYRPTIIISQGEKFSRASARSIDEFNIIEAIQSCDYLLTSSGGHPKAAGFTIKTDKIQTFKNKLSKITEEALGKIDLSPTIKIDAGLDLEMLNFDLHRMMQKLYPFGRGNSEPVFTTSQVKISDAQLMGTDNQHLKINVEDGSGQLLEAVGFNMGEFYSKLSREKPIDIAYNLLINTWNGHKKLQLRLKDIKLK